jgi:hypothetical protein
MVSEEFAFKIVRAQQLIPKYSAICFKIRYAGYSIFSAFFQLFADIIQKRNTIVFAFIGAHIFLNPCL